MGSGIGPRELLLEEVARARRMTPAERLLEGLALTERAFGLALDGLRHRFPGDTDEQRLARLRRHLDLLEPRGRPYGR
jgi:hypothetical protein